MPGSQKCSAGCECKKHVRRSRTEETRRRMSEAQQGRVVTAEHRQKISIALTGRKQSPETIARKSRSLQGHAVSEETRQKIAAAWTADRRSHLSMQQAGSKWAETHGLSSHPHYVRWSMMMARCFNSSSSSYKNYGGRGITVCQDWQDVSVFVRYCDEVLGPCPSGHSMDRVDNDGDYEPGNIRWASASEQATNRRPRIV